MPKVHFSSHGRYISSFSIPQFSIKQLLLTSRRLAMPRNLFSRSSTKQADQAPPPSLPEHVSSSPPHEKPLSFPWDKTCPSDADENVLKSSLLRSSSPLIKSASDISLSEIKSTWRSIYRTMPMNDSSTQFSTHTGNLFPQR